ncbi:MAG: cobalamin biosynthesis protein [Succinivibrionaceae bacterium]|nr:cobalamin biosynthesis protein [Succinivibrionaceae bacterium]
MNLGQLLGLDAGDLLARAGERLWSILDLPPVILLIAVIIELLLPKGSVFRLSMLIPLFRHLSIKVNKSRDKEAHRLFAGVLLSLLIYAFALSMLVIFRYVASFDSLVSLLLLLFLLELRSTAAQGRAVANCLASGDLMAAREALAPLVLRSVNELSAIGVAKAACESMCLRLFTSWFAIMAWFLVAGIEGSFFMALTCALAQSFNAKLPSYQAFGSLARRAEEALLMLPALILMICLMLSLAPLRTAQAALWGWERYAAPVSGMVLGAVGYRLGIALGGPRIYAGEKIRYHRLGGRRQPTAEDIGRTIVLLRRCGLGLLCAAIILEVFVLGAGDAVAPAPGTFREII